LNGGRVIHHFRDLYISLPIFLRACRATVIYFRIGSTSPCENGTIYEHWGHATNHESSIDHRYPAKKQHLSCLCNRST